MSKRGHKVGRVKLAFSAIEAIAAAELAGNALAQALSTSWELTRHSALYRCKNGSYTLSLIWHGADGSTLTRTIRGLRLGEAA